MSQPAESGLSLRGLSRSVFRHKRKVAGFFVATMTLVTVTVLLLPRGYRSEAKLFVRLGRENVMLDPTTTLNQAPVVAVPQSRENEINSVIEILRSRPLLEQVVDRVGADTVLGTGDLPADFGRKPATPPAESSRQRDRAVRVLGRKIEVDAVKKSNIIVCIWQVRGRSAVSFADWVRMDVQYIRSQSLQQDFKLLLLTVPAVLLRRGAH